MPQFTAGPVVGVFATRLAAEAAIHKLWHAGFAKEQIGFILPGGERVEADTPMGKLEEQGANGAAVGSVAGGVVGALIGAGIGIAIPGLGVAIAGGILAEIGLGTAAGAAFGAYTGPFLAMGFSDKDVRRYEHDVSTDRGVLLVKAGPRQQEAALILRDHGALSVETPEVQPATTNTKP